MSHDSVESSVEGGQPVELYRFFIGSAPMLLTDYQSDLVFQTELYNTAPISRTDLKQSQQKESINVDIKLSALHPLALLFVDSVPGQPVTVEIISSHLSEILGAQGHADVWQGQLIEVDYDGELGCTLRFQPGNGLFRRTAPRFRFSITCNHILYDPRCSLNRELFKHTNVVTAVADDEIDIQGLDVSHPENDFYVAGYVRHTVGAVHDYRMILEQNTDTVRLLLPFANTVLGEEVTAYAGCKHDYATCGSKFGNQINFGGFPFIPIVNPFTTELR